MPSRLSTLYPKILQLAQLFGTNVPSATMEVTTSAPNTTFTIAALAASYVTTINWGDGTTDEVTTEEAEFAHEYADAGTYTITFPDAGAITQFAYWDSGLTINSADIVHMSGLKQFEVYEVEGVFNTRDVRGWRPDKFVYESSLGSFTVDSSDLVYWNPEYFDLSYTDTVSGRFDSADIAHWRPQTFYFGRFLGEVSLGGRLDLGDMTDWRPIVFGVYAVKDESFAYVLNSADVADWRPENFSLWQLGPGNDNLADTTGIFDTADVAAWELQTGDYGYSVFALDTLPSTVTVTVDLNDFENWNPQDFFVRTMSHADVTVRTGIISTWTNLETFNLSNAGLSQSDVNTLLSELYAQAQVKTSEGAAVIDLRNNAVPSGTYQSACPPTTGKEFAYALLNDPCTVIAHPYTSVLYDA